MSVGRPRWTWRSTCSTACWSWDARTTSAMIGRCFSCRLRISPLIAGCPWRGRFPPTRSTGSSASVAAARRRRLGRITEGRWPSEREQSVWLGEHSPEELFGALQPLLSEHDGLGLVPRVADQALLVEPVQRIPIKPLPGPPVVVKGRKEERQHRFDDLVRVERHAPTLPVSLDLRWGSWPHAYSLSRLGADERLRH